MLWDLEVNNLGRSTSHNSSVLSSSEGMTGLASNQAHSRGWRWMWLQAETSAMFPTRLEWLQGVSEALHLRIFAIYILAIFSQTLMHTSISLDSSPTLPMLRGGKETQQRRDGALWRSGLAHLPDHQILTPQGWLPWTPLLSPRMHLALPWVALLNALLLSWLQWVSKR